MFIRFREKPMDTPLPEGIPWGKSPLDRGDFFIVFKKRILIELRSTVNSS